MVTEIRYVFPYEKNVTLWDRMEKSYKMGYFNRVASTRPGLKRIEFVQVKCTCVLIFIFIFIVIFIICVIIFSVTVYRMATVKA